MTDNAHKDRIFNEWQHFVEKFRLWVLSATNAENIILIGFSVTKILKKEKGA